jgi:uncharacterized protein YfaS (alpha-2-macroglobulin family)
MKKNSNRRSGNFFSAIFGELNWSSPPWARSLRRQAAERPGIFWGATLAIIALIFAVVYTYCWYKHQPKPNLPIATITTPKISQLSEDEIYPDDLWIDFNLKDKEGNSVAQAVAPLQNIGKEVDTGITLTPPLEGKWVWESDSRLKFTPAKDWPAGQTYNVHFAQEAFAPNIKMDKMEYSFSTLPFEAQISELKFYQDPVDSKVRQAVATVNFNYPVDTSSFENHTTLMYQSLKNGKLDLKAEQFKFSVTYDKQKRVAYLRSAPLAITDVARYLILTIDKGVKSASNSKAETMSAVSKNLLIPDISNYFKVASVSTNIVRNERDRPEQVLAIETSLGMTEAELKKSLHVYLLPANYPATATEEEKQNFQWSQPGEVTANILALSTPVKLTTIPAEQNYAALHSFTLNAPTPRYLYIKIDKGTRGFGDFTLTNAYTGVFQVPEYPKEIGFIHKGALLALSGEKKLSVLVRGLPAVKFEFARIRPENVNQLVTQTEGDFNNPYFINYTFNQQNISEIFSEIQQFDARENKQQYTALDFNRYLSAAVSTGGPQGLFLLQAKGWDVENKVPLEAKANRLILLTDLAMVVKDNQDGSHDVFVQSITQGMPVANAAVSVLGKNGLPLLSYPTDLQGRVHFPSLKDYIEDREPVVYLASLGSDVSFIPYNKENRQLNYSRFDTGGVYTNNDQHSLSSYIFSDRGIYRPGDAVHVGMIVKQAYVQPQPPGLTLQATVTDPRGTTIVDKKFTLDELGYLSFDFSTTDSSPTGQYYISLYIVKDQHTDSLLGSASIKVAEFQPDRMRIQSNFSQKEEEGWISPNGLSASVQLWNLYGAAAVDRRVSAKILLEPKRVEFAKYKDYIFADPLVDANKSEKVFTDNLTDTKTNDQGMAEFKLNLERFDKATYQLTFFAEGFEAEGGRSVTTQTSTLVSPLPYFIGYKPDGDLGYIKQNSQRSINYIAVNQQLKQQTVSDLQVQLVQLLPVSTLIKNPDGTYQYKSIIQTKILSTQPLALSERGTAYTLPTQEIGNYGLNILDKNNTELSRLKFSVVGESQVPLAKNAELTVKLERSEYKAGEDIELQITAPYTGAGLITIERDKVYSVQWFKTEATSSVQKIHIPEDFQGNGYVNVAFVRDWNSPDIFINPLSYSVTPFAVDHARHDVQIELNAPELARPGEPFKIQYQTDKPGKIIVFAVDEGILQVARYETPDPLAFFFQKRALEVLTQQTVDQILPQFLQDRELSAVGGDGGEDMLSKYLNPFKRKTDLPVVFWSGIVDTDSAPRELTYDVPDYFNGAIRVMAVAVTMDSVGAADKKSEVRGNFIINPNTPTFVAPGDEFEISASIANNVKGSGDSPKVAIELHVSPNIEVIGSSDEALVIPEGREHTVRFKLRAKSKLGSERITVEAALGDKTSSMDATLSIRPATPFYTSIQSGASKDAKTTLTVDRDFFPEYRTVEAALADNPLILVSGLQRYLDNYPYGCTEQLVSKAMPLLAMGSQPWFAEDVQKIHGKIVATIQMISQRQMSNGGISYWPGMQDNDNNLFASVYALHFLTEAKAQGYDIPGDLLSSGLGYLKESLTQNPNDIEMARLQAYAIYVLTRNEIVTTNYLTNLQLYLDKEQAKVWRQDITGAYIAATYQLLKSFDEANRLIDQYQPKSEESLFTNFYDYNIGNAEYLYLVARHFPEKLKGVSDKLTMNLVAALNNDDINTVLSAYTSLAFAAMANEEMAGGAGFSILEILEDNTQKNLLTLVNRYGKASVDENAKQVVFNNTQQQNYFYQLIQAGFEKQLPQQEIQQGMDIHREYRDAKGNVIESAALGSEIEVHIQVRSQKDYIFNAAIVDLLPGGFEVVRDSVKSDDAEYIDVREDRVVFFGGLDTSAKELIYHIKAISTGKFAIPPILAESMYDPTVKALGKSGTMTVTPP